MNELDKMPPHIPIRYTPCERRILKALSDGEAHLATELINDCLNDELSVKNTLATHIGNIRKKLPKDEYIVCEVAYRRTYYRHVIIITSRANILTPTPSPQNGHSDT